jgi:hypothetical protein
MSIAAQPAAAEAAEEAPPATSIAALPHVLLAMVLARLPVDTRLRAAEVCRSWRHVLATERDLWTALDLSRSSGVTHAVTDALLCAAAAKAGGGLETLDVSGCYPLSYDALLAVVTDSADSLLELRATDTVHAGSCEKAQGLLRAAPLLRESPRGLAASWWFVPASSGGRSRRSWRSIHSRHGTARRCRGRR